MLEDASAFIGMKECYTRDIHLDNLCTDVKFSVRGITMKRSSRDYLCYCGLNCKICTIVTTIPQDATRLRNTLVKNGMDVFGQEIYEGFSEFWDVLKKMSELAETCTLCQGTCGDPDCKIRVCAREKGVEVCALCDEYPCDLIREYDKKYHVLIRYNDRIREIGLDPWLAEMEELAARGITFFDLMPDDDSTTEE